MLQTEDLYVKISFGKIHYIKRSPNGVPTKRIVFLHGLGGTARVWTKLFDCMPEDFELVALDLPGHGDSDAPQMKYTVEKNLELFGEFLNATKMNDFCLFGNSLGGWISALYAMKSAVRALILESAAGMKDEFEQLREAGTAEEHKNYIMKISEAISTNKSYVISSALNSDNSDLELTQQTLANIKAKTLIIWGTRDNIVDPSMADLFHSRIVGSELHVVEGAGHVPHYTNPDEIAKIVTAFLANV